VLNRGEATNALKRLIYTGRVASYQAKSEDEMQAVVDALSLLANVVMAWNTTKMQAIFDRWARRRNGAIPPELIARCAPTRTEGLNMHGISASRSSSTSSNCCRPGRAQKSNS
jgi:Tn3 transposase DDE domain